MYKIIILTALIFLHVETRMASIETQVKFFKRDFYLELLFHFT